MALKEALPELDRPFTSLFQTLRIMSHLTGAGIRKCEGYSAVHLILIMFTSVFLNLPGLCGYARLNMIVFSRGYREPEVDQPAGAKLPPQPKWAALFTPDVSLAADAVGP